MSSRIPRRDTELRFGTKFGENRPLRSCRKVLWITTQKNSGSVGLVPAPILPKMDRSRPKFPERCQPLTCPRTPNLVRIGCALPRTYSGKIDFSAPKVITRTASSINDNILTRTGQQRTPWWSRWLVTGWPCRVSSDIVTSTTWTTMSYKFQLVRILCSNRAAWDLAQYGTCRSLV